MCDPSPFLDICKREWDAGVRGWKDGGGGEGSGPAESHPCPQR